MKMQQKSERLGNTFEGGKTMSNSSELKVEEERSFEVKMDEVKSGLDKLVQLEHAQSDQIGQLKAFLEANHQQMADYEKDISEIKAKMEAKTEEIKKQFNNYN